MKYTCQCCGYNTFSKPQRSYDICPICFWEDDYAQNENPFYCGGTNIVSLNQAQRNFNSFGVCELKYKTNVRQPIDNDEFDELWQEVKQDNERKELIIIDLTGIQNSKELHEVLKNALMFPDFYGMNWDAFWDLITGLIEIPKKIIFIGWYEFEVNQNRDAKILKQCFKELKENYLELCPDVEFYQYKYR